MWTDLIKKCPPQAENFGNWSIKSTFSLVFAVHREFSKISPVSLAMTPGDITDDKGKAKGDGQGSF